METHKVFNIIKNGIFWKRSISQNIQIRRAIWIWKQRQDMTEKPACWPKSIRSYHSMAAHTQKWKPSLSWGYLQCHLPLMYVSLGLWLKKPTCLASCQAFYSDLRTDRLTEDSLSHAPSSFNGRKAIPWPHGKMGSTLLPHKKAAGACTSCTDL